MILIYNRSSTPFQHIYRLKTCLHSFKKYLTCCYSFRNYQHWLGRCPHGILGKGDAMTSGVFVQVAELLKGSSEGQKELPAKKENSEIDWVDFWENVQSTRSRYINYKHIWAKSKFLGFAMVCLVCKVTELNAVLLSIQRTSTMHTTRTVAQGSFPIWTTYSINSLWCKSRRGIRDEERSSYLIKTSFQF